jgi:hypothetical protein
MGLAADIDQLHDWVLSLPWVVERPYSLGWGGVRIFAIDCPPIDVRKVWLVTGLVTASGIAVVVPDEVADEFEVLDLARSLSPMPAGHVLASVCEIACRDVERVVLEAYASAMA